MEAGCLIPGLPHDVSLQILARVPRKYYSQHLPKVSPAWKEALTCPALFNQRKWLQVTESWVYTAVVREHENRTSILWFARDLSAECLAWFPLPLMPIEHRPVYGFNCTVFGELLFVIGGCEWPERTSFSFPAMKKVSVLNARTNRWSCIQGMNDARVNCACAIVNGKVYVAGGERSVDVVTVDDSSDLTDSCNCLRSSEAYDPLTNEWESMGNMTRAMHFVRGRVIDGKFRVCGFICEGDLQFCEVGEEWEEAEMKWVKLQLQEHHNGTADVSMFEIEDHYSPSQRNEIENESAVIASMCNSCQPRFCPKYNGMVEIKNDEDVNDFGNRLCECEDHHHARLAITL